MVNAPYTASEAASVAMEKTIVHQALNCPCAGFAPTNAARQNPPGAGRLLPGVRAWSA